MIPDQLKKMFGLNSKQDLSMANNIWKMLDQMSESSPENYQQFIQKNIKEGVQGVKQQKQNKQRPFKTKPQKGFRVQFNVHLEQKMISNYQNKFQQKLDVTKQKWDDVKKKIKPKLKIGLNICYSDRIKLPLSAQKKQLQTIKIANIKQIEVFYHSINGPKEINNANQLHYLFVISKNVYQSLMKEQKGRQMIMSLAISYFQQRFQNDKNQLLKLYNPQLYKKLAYYAIQKQSIQLSKQSYLYGNDINAEDILFQIDSDIKRSNQLNEQQQKLKKKMQKDQKQKVIKFKEDNLSKQDLSQPQFSANSNNLSKKIEAKKPLIQVLDQKLNDFSQESQNQNIPYSLIQKQDEVQIEFLIPGIKSIQQLNLQIGGKCIKLSVIDSKKFCEINLSKLVNQATSVAKFKKKQGKLLLTVRN